MLPPVRSPQSSSRKTPNLLQVNNNNNNNSSSQNPNSSFSPRSGVGVSMMGGRSLRRGQQQLSFPNNFSRAIERDEERYREALMTEYALDATALDSESFHYSTASFRRSVDKMVHEVQAMHEQHNKARSTQEAMIASLDGLNGQVNTLGHVLGVLSDVHTESVKAQMMTLRVQNATLVKEVETLTFQLELERAQVAALKGTLRGHIARSREQVEELRDEVRERISAEAIDLQSLKKDLIYRFDAVGAALTFVKTAQNNNNNNTETTITATSTTPAPPTSPSHNNNNNSSSSSIRRSQYNNNTITTAGNGENTHKAHAFDPRLTHLQEGIAEANRLIEARYNSLREVLHGIRVSNECAQSLSIHSNIPTSFRTALVQFSQEELITLLDTLSFEPGVVSAIGSAVFAKHSTRQK
jgi:hypothetical protein